MDLSLWGWVVSQPHGPQEARGRVEEALPRFPQRCCQSPTSWLALQSWVAPPCPRLWGGVPGSIVWVMGRLVTCSCVLSCRSAGHRAAGVRGWRQEDRVSALLPLR